MKENRADIFKIKDNEQKYKQYEELCDYGKMDEIECVERQSDFQKIRSFTFQRMLVPSNNEGRLLFQTNATTYLYAGEDLYSFTVTNGDHIVKLYNKIIKAGASYPVAVGHKYVYFLDEGQYVDRNLIPGKTTLKNLLTGLTGDIVRHANKLHQFKILATGNRY